MWVRIRVDRSKVKRRTEATARKPGRRSSQQPHLEALEDRQLLTATLQSIPNLSVPAQQGFTAAACSPPPTRQRTPRPSPSPPATRISPASIIQGQFWTLGRHYTDPVTPRTASPAP